MFLHSGLSGSYLRRQERAGCCERGPAPAEQQASLALSAVRGSCCCRLADPWLLGSGRRGHSALGQVHLLCRVCWPGLAARRLGLFSFGPLAALGPDDSFPLPFASSCFGAGLGLLGWPLFLRNRLVSYISQLQPRRHPFGGPLRPPGLELVATCPRSPAAGCSCTLPHRLCRESPAKGLKI